jgi:DNA repair protein RadC
MLIYNETGTGTRMKTMSNSTQLSKVENLGDAYDAMVGNETSTKQYKLLALNNSNEIVGKFSLNSSDLTGENIKSILSSVINEHAAKIISGVQGDFSQLTPSLNEIRIAKKIKQFASELNLTVVDYLIMTDSSYYSFGRNGKRF